ncbi:SUMF1/EgtB/PvdO family nonheme iron enzyme [Sphaerotilus montanus]|uniref:SUMF1/EgtB/PvdO family nonheme iron enzyme n=1 Tax=Sphaerotilus montanus TaxID=522889 RepID=UPI003FA2A665
MRLTSRGPGALLRALHDACEGRLDDQLPVETADRCRRWAEMLGYELAGPVAPVQVWGAETPTQQPLSLPEAPPQITFVEEDDDATVVPPLSTTFFLMTGYRKLDDAECERATPSGDVSGGVEPLTSAQCKPLTTQPPAHVPLVRSRVLWPALQRSLAEPWIGGLDLPRLTRDLARARLPVRLPRRSDSGWGAALHVVIDRADHLTPFESDYLGVLDLVRRLHGAGGMRVWAVDGLPVQPPGELTWRTAQQDEPWLDRTAPAWLPRRDGHCDAGPAGALQPPPGSTVVVLGDAGSLATGSAAAQSWALWLRGLAARRCRVVVWAPCGPRWVSPELTGRARVHCLVPGAAMRVPLRRQPVRHEPDERRAALRDRLLTRAAICLHLAPPMLRSLRLGDAALRQEPAVEAWAWAAGALVHGSLVSRALVAEHAVRYRERFGRLPASEQRDILARVQAGHAHLGRSTGVAEVMVWAAHVGDEVRQAEVKAVKDADDWLQAWQVWVEREASVGARRRAAQDYARDLLGRLGADARVMERQADWGGALWALSGQSVLPDGLDAEAAQRAKVRFDPQWAQGEAVDWSMQPIRWAPGGVALVPAGLPGQGAGIRFTGGSCLVQAQAGERHMLGPASSPLHLPSAGAGGQVLTLRTDTLECVVTEMGRPAWASEWGEDRYGVFADLEISGVTQRMRWIPPGWFLMGSPSDEAERSDFEGPHHEVTLTEGYWLADTACTQALWKAVTGKIPSQFKDDPQLPVEKVSSDDVTERFLPALNRQLGEGAAYLPTEAQWEYACRAGTTTAYEFGDAFDPARANVSGGAGNTVPVRQFPPSRWGLYQMHGNVLEWCADARRSYTEESVTDPEGGQDGSDRAVRGGSWLCVAKWSRSAFRGINTRYFRLGSFGFRFALRSVEQGR